MSEEVQGCGYTEDYCRRGYGCVIIVAALVSVAATVTGLALYGSHKTAQSNEGISWAIGILGTLLTFAVAWQIWQTMASREEIKDARKAAKKANKVAKEVASLKTEFENSLNLFAAYRASSDGLSFLLNNRPFKAFHLFATAIIDSLKFINDQGKCAMGAFVNLDNCMDFNSNDTNMKEFTEKWDSVVNRLNEIEEALRNADQENKIFQAMAKQHIDAFKNAAREKGLKI